MKYVLHQSDIDPQHLAHLFPAHGRRPRDLEPYIFGVHRDDEIRTEIFRMLSTVGELCT